MHRYLVIVLVLCSFYALIPHENTNFIKYRNFTADDSPVSGYHDLKIWANFQMMEVIPDNRAYGLSDGICRFVPKEGLDFLLTADPEKKRNIYLYLDFAVFRFINPNARFPQHKLNVYVNGKLKHTIVFGQKPLDSPLAVTVDPAELVYDKMTVFLQPDVTTGNFWCIWDSFYSYEKI